MSLPPLPDGASLDELPPLPEGASLDGELPPLPDGAVLNTEPQWGFTSQELSGEVEAQRAAEAELNRRARNERLKLAFAESRRTSEDDAATALAVAKRLNVPFDTVRKNLPAFKETAAAANFDPEAWATENPELAKLITENPELGPLVMRSKDAGPIVKALRAAGDWLSDVAGVMSSQDIKAQEDLAKQMAEDPDAALRRADTIEQDERVRKELARAKRDIPQQVLERDDARAKLLRESTDSAAVPFILWQRAVETKAALDLSRKQVRLMLAENGYGGDPAALAVEIHEAKLNSMPRAFGDDSGIMRDLSEAMQGAVSTVDVGADALTGAGTAASLGFAVGAGGTLAVTGNPGLAIEAGVLAARTWGAKGATAATFLSAMSLETGASYEASGDIVTDRNQRLTQGERMGLAVVEGFAKGALEVISFGQQTKVLKEALPETITGLVKKDPKFRELLVRVGVEYGKSVLMEGGTEGVQDAIEQVGDYLGASLKDGALQKRDVIDPDRTIQAVQGGVLGASMSGGVTHSLALATTRTFDAKAQVTDRIVEPTLQLAEQPLGNAAPKETARLVEDATGAKAFYTEAKEIVRFFQEKGEDADAANATVAEILGPDAPAKLAEAVASGGKLEVSLEAAVSTWGKSELGKAMLEHTTTDPNALTPAQRKAQQAEIEARAEAMAQSIEAASKEAEALVKQTQELEDQLIKLGMPKDQAKAGVALVRSYMTTQAADFGKAVKEVFPDGLVAFGRGDEAPTTGDVRLPQPERTDAERQDLGGRIMRAAQELEAQPLGQTVAFSDSLTGLRTLRGMRLLPTTEGQKFVAFTSTDIKPLNDNKQLGHEQANRMIRAKGLLAESLDPEAGRGGTNFVMKTTLEQAKAAEAKWREQLPPELRDTMKISFGEGSSIDEALAAMEEQVDAGRAKGRVTEKLDAKPFDAELMAEFPDAPELPGDRMGTKVPIEKLIQQKELLALGDTPARTRPAPQDIVEATKQAFKSTLDFAKDRYFDAATALEGLGPIIFNKEGWKAVGERAWTVAFDGIGLQSLNVKFATIARDRFGMSRREANAWGKKVGDNLLHTIAQAAHKSGGAAVVFSRLSGDEFAAKHDNREELLQFAADLHAAVKEISDGLYVTLPDGTKEKVDVGIRWGLGDTYEAADQDLNARKEGKLGDGPGRDAQLPGAGTAAERAGRAASRGTLPASRLGLGQSAEGRAEEVVRFAQGERANDKSKPAVIFEVAPDPNDAALANEWRKLDASTRSSISLKVAEQIVPKVLEVFGVEARSPTEQLGGYDNDVNPSLRLSVSDASKAVPIAKLLGYVLAQDSMVITSPTQVEGMEETGVITVEGITGVQAADLYRRLREGRPENDQPVGGFTHAGSTMYILNYSGLDDVALGELVAEKAGGHEVHADKVYTAFPSKEGYGYAVHGQEGQAAAGSSAQSEGGRSDDSLRAEGLRTAATEAVRSALDDAKREAARAGQEVTRLNQANELRKGGGSELPGIDRTQENLTRTIGEKLQDWVRSKWGATPRDEKGRTPEHQSRIARWMVDEVRYALKNPVNSGVGWYSTKWQQAIDNFGELFPELKTEKSKRDFFTLLFAIMSDGQKVVTNTKFAVALYQNFRKNDFKRVDMDGTFGSQRMAGMRANVDRINKLLDKHGLEGIHEVLLKEATVSELKAAKRIEYLKAVEKAKEEGKPAPKEEKLNTEYEGDVHLPQAALILGPKLGAFYANLMGSHGYLTMDRWWSRTFNRYRGQLITTPTRAGVATFKRMLGLPDITDAEAIERTKPLRVAYEARDFKPDIGPNARKEASPEFKAENRRRKEEGKPQLKLEKDTLNREQVIQLLQKETLKGLTKRGAFDEAAVKKWLGKKDFEVWSKLQTVEEQQRFIGEKAARKMFTDKSGRLVEGGPDINKRAKELGYKNASKMLENVRLERAANTIYKAAFLELEDTPFNAGDRTFMLDTVNEAQQVLEKEFGQKLSVADIQAILWYYEKRLYVDLGAKESSSVSYEDISQRLVSAVRKLSGAEDGGPEGLAARAAEFDVLGRIDKSALDLGRDEGEDGPGDDSGDTVDEGEPDAEASDGERLEQDSADVPKGYTELPAGRALQSAIRIFLNKAADISTVIHELGHAFLEHQFDLAERSDAPERTKKIVADIFTAFGIKSRTEMTRKQKEQFARAFERYNFEGQAPNGLLKKAFTRFARWIVGIYGTLSGIPGAEMAPQLKPVFDAMLATEKQLEAVRRAQGPQLTAEQLQLKVEERQAQLEEEADDYREGSHAVQLAAIKDALRMREQWWKTGLRKLEANFRDEYEQLPARVVQRLISGEETGEPMVLDRALVQEVIGDLKVPGLRTVEQGGVRPSLVAEMAGYSSPRAMLAELAGLRSRDVWAKAMAESEMRRLHPGILDDLKKFRAQLADGLRGATEQRLMREVQGLDREATKRAAEKLVQRRQVSKLQPGRALVLQRNAASEKAKAMAKGDITATRVAAQSELLNHYLHTELLRAEEEVQRFAKQVRRLGKTAARERLGKASPAYRNAVDFIRGAFGVGEVDPQLDTGTIDAAIAQLEGDAVTIGDPDWAAALRAAIAKTDDFAQLTMAELGAVRDALKMIEAGARGRTELLVDGRRMDFEQVKGDVLKEIASTLPPRGPLVSDHQKTTRERIFSKLSALDGYLLSVVDFVRDLTGDNADTALHRALINTMRRAQGLEADLLEQRVAPVLEAIDAMPKSVRAGLNDTIDGKALFPQHRPDVEVPRKRYELLALALNSGSESSRGVLTEGRGIPEGQLLAALNELTKEEIDFVNSVHASLEVLREPAFDLEERETGLRPKAVEALPTNLKNGRLTGGYYPLKAEPEASTVGARQFGDDQMAALFDPTFSRPSTSHGHLKSRTGATYPVSLDLDVMRKHLVQVAHDIAFRESVKSAARLIMDPDVQRELTGRLGPEKTKEFLFWLKDIGGGSGLQSTPADTVMGFFKKNLSTSALSGLSTAIGNFANLAAALTSTKLQSKHLAAGIAQVLATPWDMVKGTSTIHEQMLEKSGVARAESSQLLQQIQNDLISVRKGKLSKASKRLAEAGLLAMRSIDGIVSTAVWTGAYRQAIAQKLDEGAAVRFADDALLRVQPSKAIAEKSRILRDKGTWVGAATIFYSYLNVAYRAQHRLAAPLFTQEFRNAGPLKKTGTAMKVAANLLAFYVAVQVLGDLGMGRGPEAGDADDEEPERELLKWKNWFLRKVAVAPLSLVPVLPLTALAEGALLDKRVSPRAEPTSATLFQFMKLARVMGKEDVEDREIVRAALPLVGAFTGWPSRFFDVTGLYAWDAVNGNTEVDGPLGLLSGLLYGQKEDQPENALTALDQAAQ